MCVSRFATAACMQKYGNVRFATVACAKCMRYGGRGGGPYHGGGGGNTGHGTIYTFKKKNKAIGVHSPPKKNSPKNSPGAQKNSIS